MARGRWIEFATERDDRICGGTVAFLDGLIGASFEFLGETPPDDVFVRYEWVEEPDEPTSLTGLGKTFRFRDGGILIQTDQLIDEHELGHAVPASVWPKSARFLREGLAVLLDGRRIYDQNVWPSSKSIDSVIEGDFSGGNNYFESWFIVSQIMRDHGIEGLRGLWHAVPAEATAADVRRAYEDLFDRPIDALLERTPFNPDTMVGGVRAPCKFSLCPGIAQPLDGGAVFAPGPSGCEDDPNAIGPHSRFELLDGPPVWRETTITPTRWSYPEPSDTLAATSSPCFLECYRYGSGRVVWIPGMDQWGMVLRPAGSWRIEVRQELEALPTEDPGGIVFDESP
ncbi:MAG: hypothetical protein JKY37_16900 [Nannocystaceae bacterium]|nr:hypothetical protein [Nannocystaceae bacterium]